MGTRYTSPQFPPSPKEFGIMATQIALLSDELHSLMLCALRSLPDMAPFDLTGIDSDLWRRCMDAERLLMHWHLYDPPLPLRNDVEEVETDESHE